MLLNWLIIVFMKKKIKGLKSIDLLYKPSFYDELNIY